MKACRVCGEEKEKKEYRIMTDRKKRKYRLNICRDCERARGRGYYHAHKVNKTGLKPSRYLEDDGYYGNLELLSQFYIFLTTKKQSMQQNLCMTIYKNHCARVG